VLHPQTTTPRGADCVQNVKQLKPPMLNILLGTYLIRQPAGWRRILQCVGSVLMIIATCLLVAAFVREPHLSSGRRSASTALFSLLSVSWHMR
jgi:hypothetical protein